MLPNRCFIRPRVTIQHRAMVFSCGNGSSSTLFPCESLRAVGGLQFRSSVASRPLSLLLYIVIRSCMMIIPDLNDRTLEYKRCCILLPHIGAVFWPPPPSGMSHICAFVLHPQHLNSLEQLLPTWQSWQWQQKSALKQPAGLFSKNLAMRWEKMIAKQPF